MKQITIAQPDDFHLHLRDTPFMESVVNHSAKQFGRAIIMPNIQPPITDTSSALQYKERILKAINNDNHNFTPLMTLYLTNNTTPADIIEASASKIIFAIKLYPAGATTNSDAGVSDIKNCAKTLEKMEELGIPLSIHCEVTDPKVDIFDRERVYIDTELQKITIMFPDLRIICEHATTKDMVQFIESAPANIASTITPHHLFITRNEIFNSGINPHNYCLPIAKTREDKEYLIKAATSGNPKFFAGTDSAPHPLANKEKAGGAAGIYSAFCAIELYTEIFDQADKLNNLEAFTSHNGADFYNIPRNTTEITLIKQAWDIPNQFPFGDTHVKPFMSNQTISWKIKT